MKKGFTLIELMVAIVIMGILVALAVPGFKGLISDKGLVSYSDDLIEGIRFARQMAMTGNGNVNLVSSSTGLSGGFSVMQNGNTYKTFNAWPSSISINSMSGVLASASTVNVTFFADGSSSVSGNNDVRFCDKTTPGARGRVVILNSSGFSSIGLTNQNDNTVNNPYQKCP